MKLRIVTTVTFVQTSSDVMKTLAPRNNDFINGTVPSRNDTELISHQHLTIFFHFYAQAWMWIVVVGIISNSVGLLIVWSKQRVRKIAPIQW